MVDLATAVSTFTLGIITLTRGWYNLRGRSRMRRIWMKKSTAFSKLTKRGTLIVSCMPSRTTSNRVGVCPLCAIVIQFVCSTISLKSTSINIGRLERNSLAFCTLTRSYGMYALGLVTAISGSLWMITLNNDPVRDDPPRPFFLLHRVGLYGLPWLVPIARAIVSTRCVSLPMPPS